MNIAILGAGALGSVIGAHLAKAGLSVTLLDLNQAHIDAVTRDGLRVDWEDGTDILPIAAARPEACPKDTDLILLLTKTYHSDAALTSVASVIAGGAFVMTLQNGLGNVETLLRHVPDNRVLYGCTMTPGDFRGPGHVASHGKAHTPFTAWQASPEAEALAAPLAAAGFHFTATAPAQVWQKAAFNCAMNATTALAGVPVGGLAAAPGATAITSAIAAEVIALAQAEGIDATLSAVEGQIAYAFANHGRHKASMLQDLQHGRATEIGALNGYVARRSSDLGLPAPLNTLLAILMLTKEAAPTA
ncbi:ketopantoate reductase family protein [Nioella nitratireducens]|uniref:ketopantoate reductase family protein n=1 Tax=Nioella nitratireducens TaxID=1287720 RepID=UPI0008FD62A9|nr:ketopantoate reductase family protein [Nioella nitratireducens]